MDHEGPGLPFPPDATCPLCGGYASLKKTKNDRVSAFCSRCSSRLFINSWSALEGYLALSMQVDGNREAWMEEMDSRAALKVGGPARSITEVDSVVLAEHLQKAAANDQDALKWVLGFPDGASALRQYMHDQESARVQSNAAYSAAVAEPEQKKREELH